MLENKEINGNNQEDENNESYHIPVLLVESVEGLLIKENGIYVDCTFGGGGHSKEILKKLGSKGRLFVFDQDLDAKANLPEDERIEFIPQNFRHIQRFLRLLGVQKVDGILADLGVSSHQFDEAERGFSIRFDADLDMRMDKRQALTASKILATYDEQALHKLFEKYGEVSNSKTLARTIVAKRNLMPMQTINQFKLVIREVVMGNPNKYLAKVFQAIRIEVNDEMGALRDLLEQSLELLNAGGRLAIITFHSLEDRMVKNFFKTGSIEEVQADDVFGTKPKSPLKIITKKPIEATAAELKRNNRSRSAGLRIAEKI
jgi:16S rRNA (cytosine1402-N4)-methyltransferase